MIVGLKHKIFFNLKKIHIKHITIILAIETDHMINQLMLRVTLKLLSDLIDTFDKSFEIKNYFTRKFEGKLVVLF